MSRAASVRLVLTLDEILTDGRHGLTEMLVTYLDVYIPWLDSDSFAPLLVVW